MKYGFVYIWFDRKHKRFYIGSHWGKVEDTYICSSRWMRKAYKRRPQDFKRRILSTNLPSTKETFVKEQEWLNLIKEEELGKRYYNLNNKVHHWTMYPEKIKTIGEKISIAHKNNPEWASWWIGRKHSEETLQKISKGRKGKRGGSDHPMYGRKHTEAELQIMREKRATQVISEDHKKRISEANKGKIISEAHKEILRKPKEKVKCPHCSKIGGKPTMTRYHFNNCKSK